MIAKSKKEIEILKEGGQILARILSFLAKEVKPGLTTAELNRLAEEEIVKANGESSFLGYKQSESGKIYPASICVSINDEIVHGLPGARKIQEGDVVSLDLGIKYRGLLTDAATTVAAGRADPKAQKLILVCREALGAGINECRAGRHVGDIGYAIQKYVESQGFKVIKELVGHGVGRKVHEEPQIPNWGKPGTGPALKEGQVLALEPMIVEGKPQIFLDKDCWTWRTKDGSRAAHFEHTVLVSEDRPIVLTLL